MEIVRAEDWLATTYGASSAEEMEVLRPAKSAGLRMTRPFLMP
jgi:hypothetical protein